MNSSETDIKTLAEALPEQQQRCRMILEDAIRIGQPVVFLVVMLSASLSRAEKAAATGDVIEMIFAYKELQDYSA